MRFTTIEIAIAVLLGALVGAQTTYENTRTEVQVIYSDTTSAVDGSETPQPTDTGSATEESSTEESSTTEEEPTGTAGAGGATHTVRVSNEQVDLVFDPEVINADAGDKVLFVFYPNNHSVSVSSFQEPCVPKQGGGGFFSGFQPTKRDDTERPSFEVTVTDSKVPYWLYCSQTGHCQQGMVAVINPPTGASANTLDDYRRRAQDVETSESPDEPFNGTAGTWSASGARPSDGTAIGSLYRNQTRTRTSVVVYDNTTATPGPYGNATGVIFGNETAIPTATGNYSTSVGPEGTALIPIPSGTEGQVPTGTEGGGGMATATTADASGMKAEALTALIVVFAGVIIADFMM